MTDGPMDGIFTPVHSIIAGNRKAQPDIGLANMKYQATLLSSPGRSTPGRTDKKSGNHQDPPTWKKEAIHELATDFWKYKTVGSTVTNMGSGPTIQVVQNSAPDDDEDRGDVRVKEGSVWSDIKNIFLSRLNPLSAVTTRDSNSTPYPPTKKRRRTGGSVPSENEHVSVINTADSTLGAKIIISSDDFFAPARNLLNPKEPTFEPDQFGPYGKIMDGWETRRRRVPGHNWCIIRLAAPTMINRVEISTRHFTGNYAPRISLEASKDVEAGELERWLSEDYPDEMIELHSQMDRTGTGHYHDEGEEFLQHIETKMHCDDESGVWYDIIPTASLRPGTIETHSHSFLPLDTNNAPVSYLRLNQFPDGGIARLRVFGEIGRSQTPLPPDENFASLLNGACIVACSSSHFGAPSNLLLPYPPETMQSGWETARKINRPGILRMVQGEERVDWDTIEPDWVIIQLAQRIDLRMVEINTSKFIGNAPEAFSLEIIDASRSGLPPNCSIKAQNSFLLGKGASQWEEVLSHVQLQPDSVQGFDFDSLNVGTKGSLIATHIKLSILPDGGIARIAVFGNPEIRDSSFSRWTKNKQGPK